MAGNPEASVAEEHIRVRVLRLWNVSLELLLILFFPFVFLCSFEYSGSPRRRAHRSSADATGQHAASRGGGRTRERRRFCSSGGSGGSFRGRRFRQLSGAFRLQSQTVTDQTNLPHGAGEIWAGNHIPADWASRWPLAEEGENKLPLPACKPALVSPFPEVGAYGPWVLNPL